MEIKTGYFAKVKTYIDNGYLPISISRYSPKWFEGACITELAPSSDLLMRYKNGKTGISEYKTEYLDYLSRSGINLEELLKPYISDDYKGIVLCCYEKPSDFCHRHLLADFYNRHYNMNIQEYSAKCADLSFYIEDEDIIIAL